MSDELNALIDQRIQEKYFESKAEYEGKRPDGYIPKINASDFGMCKRAIKFRLLGETALEPTVDELNRYEKGREVERFVKQYLRPDEIIFEELSIETEFIRGKADLGVKIDGQSILYELKSKDRNYIKFLKTTQDTYQALKNNLFQAYFYFSNLKDKYNLSKAVVLNISEDRSWKLPFICPSEGQFLLEYESEKKALIELHQSFALPPAVYCWQCYSKKYMQVRCKYILHCVVDLKIRLNGREVIANDFIGKTPQQN